MASRALARLPSRGSCVSVPSSERLWTRATRIVWRRPAVRSGAAAACSSSITLLTRTTPVDLPGRRSRQRLALRLRTQERRGDADEARRAPEDREQRPEVAGRRETG